VANKQQDQRPKSDEARSAMCCGFVGQQAVQQINNSWHSPVNDVDLPLNHVVLISS